jgi:hypothetical protein
VDVKGISSEDGQVNAFLLSKLDHGVQHVQAILNTPWKTCFLVHRTFWIGTYVNVAKENYAQFVVSFFTKLRYKKQAREAAPAFTSNHIFKSSACVELIGGWR